MQKKYRQCASSIVFNKKGQVLLFARNDIKEDCWQFSQGGIEKNESPEEAARRELFEETSISSVKLVYADNEAISYDFTSSIKQSFFKKGIFYDGQEVFFSLYFFEGEDTEINLLTENPEFRKYKWESLCFAKEHIVSFKKDAYSKIIKKFLPKIRQYIKDIS